MGPYGYSPRWFQGSSNHNCCLSNAAKLQWVQQSTPQPNVLFTWQTVEGNSYAHHHFTLVSKGALSCAHTCTRQRQLCLCCQYALTPTSCCCCAVCAVHVKHESELSVGSLVGIGRASHSPKLAYGSPCARLVHITFQCWQADKLCSFHGKCHDLYLMPTAFPRRIRCVASFGVHCYALCCMHQCRSIACIYIVDKCMDAHVR